MYATVEKPALAPSNSVDIDRYRLRSHIAKVLAKIKTAKHPSVCNDNVAAELSCS